MRQNDPEFLQILNIIRRGQRLVLQAKNEGADTKLAEELISESKYALKLQKKEEAIEYAKKCIVEVIRAKRVLSKDTLTKEGVMEQMTKEELRQNCKELGIDSVGLKSELVARIKENLKKNEDSTKTEEAAEKVIEKVKEEPKKPDPEPPNEPSPEHQQKKSESKTEKKKDPGFDASKMASEMVPGLSYLIEEKRPEKLFHLYKALLEGEGSGLVISRTNPKILIRTYALDEGSLVWLTGKEVSGEINTVLPILEFIMSLIDEYMDENQSGVILLDGLEYLLTNNKFNSVLRFIRQVVDNVSQTECVLMVSLSPDALDSTEVTLLEKDLFPMNFV